MYPETPPSDHPHQASARDDWMASPVGRRDALVAGVTAAGIALAGCTSFGGGSDPDPPVSDAGHDDPTANDAGHDDPENTTTQMAPRQNDSTEFVGSAPAQHDTIQAAVDAAAPGGRVSITLSYDSSLEEWPVVSEKLLTIEAAGLLPRIEVPEGSDGIVFDTGNKRPPGPVLRDLTIEGGARAVVFRGTKFPKLFNCHVADCSEVAYAFEDTFESDGKTYRNGTNSAGLYRCTSLRAGEAGVRTDYMSHSIVLETCRMIHSDGFGVYFDGPANCVVRGGQYENNADAGIYARVAESVTVRDAYIEENGLGDGHFPASVVANKCDDVLIEGCYFNGLGTPYAVMFLGNASSENPTVRNCRFKSHESANVLTDVEDTDVDRVVGNIAPASEATRIRSYGTIVGPTGVGVNLKQTAGGVPGDRALSWRTPGVQDGSIAVWQEGGTWRLLRGRTVSPDVG